MGHAQAGFVQRPVCTIAVLKQRPRLLIQEEIDAEGLGDCGSGNIVMGRADSAGGEDVVEALPHFIDGRDNRLCHIGDDPTLAQAHALFVQGLGKKGDIRVLSPAGEYLVADHDHGGGEDTLCGGGFCRGVGCRPVHAFFFSRGYDSKLGREPAHCKPVGASDGGLGRP